MSEFDYGPPTLSTLRSLQLDRLRASVGHAFEHSPHYRRVLRELNLSPEDLRSLADLARFPFTTKADLRDNYPFSVMAVPMERVARLHASSGTTGKTTVVGYTKRDIDSWASLVARSLHAAGVRPGMRVHVAYGYGLFTGGLGAHYGAEALGCTVIPMSGGQTEKQVRLIQIFAPDAIMVTPSYMLAILDEFRRQGVDLAGSSLRYGIFGAEPWSDATRSGLEEAFSIKASDIYGLSELMGPGVACEFVEDRSGPTIWEDHFYPEVVDPDTGEALPDGEVGELVLTSLTREALPILRYRTRDLTRLIPGERIPMRRIAKFRARSDDMLIVRGVNLFPSQIEEIIQADGDWSPHFLIVISRLGRLDELVLNVEPRNTTNAADLARQALGLRDRIKGLAGVTVKVEPVPIGTIPRSGGKAERVRDLR